MRLVRAFGKYFSTDVPTSADFSTTEQRVITLINGVDGGTWAPTSTITIAGKGLKLNAPLKWKNTQSRVIFESAIRYSAPSTNVISGSPNWWGIDYARGGITPQAPGTIMRLPLDRLHNNARLTTVRIFFSVPQGKGDILSNTTPIASLLRYNTATGAFDSLISAGSVVFPNPATNLAYFNGGIPNALVMNLDQNNTINKGTYDYLLSYQDDTVAGPPFNTVLGVEMTFDSIQYLDKT